MQIELIATASEDSAYLPRLGLGILAALTPPEDEVIYTDDVVKPFDRRARRQGRRPRRDQRRQQDRAPQLRDRAPRTGARGVKVVLGGIHPTALPGRGARSSPTRSCVERGRGRLARAARGLQARRARSRVYKAELPEPRAAARTRGATCSPPRSTSCSRSCRPCAAARTRASSAASRRRTARPCASARPTRCSPSSVARQAHHVRRRQRDDPPGVLEGALHADDPAAKALDRAVLARRGEAPREREADGGERLQGALHRLREHRRGDAAASPGSGRTGPPSTRR